MWILPDSLQSASAPVAADSILDLNSQLAKFAQSVGLSGKPSPLTSWRRAWSRYAYIQRLSGRTCEPSTDAPGVVSWIASLRATRVSRSALPESVVDQTILDTYGRMCVESLAKLNQVSSFSKTSLATLALAGSKSSPSFKKWVSKLRRASLQRRKLMQRNDGSGSSSSLWQTVNTGGGGGKHRGGRRGGELLLPGQAEEWYSRFSRRHPTISTPGKTSRPTSGPRLNLVFVTWLMGWPVIEPLDGNSWATEWSRFKRRMRSSLFGLLSEVSKCLN